MKRLTLIVLCMLAAVTLQAKKHPPFPWDSLHHEVRVGWGDLMFEHAMRYEFTHIGKMNAQIDYITGHFFAEYQYHCLHWLAAGMQVDFSQMGWHDRRERRIDPEAAGHNYYNLCFLPTIRFTWYHSEWVNIYTAAFGGLCINGGTERDVMTGKKTICYPAFGLTMLGCQIGKKGWYGTVEWGGLSALKDVNSIVMVSSRILSVGVAYQFNPPHKKTMQP